MILVHLNLSSKETAPEGPFLVTLSKVGPYNSGLPDYDVSCNWVLFPTIVLDSFIYLFIYYLFFPNRNKVHDDRDFILLPMVSLTPGPASHIADAL